MYVIEEHYVISLKEQGTEIDCKRYHFQRNMYKLKKRSEKNKEILIDDYILLPGRES
jgi:hypothetical protein